MYGDEASACMLCHPHQAPPSRDWSPFLRGLGARTFGADVNLGPQADPRPWPLPLRCQFRGLWGLSREGSSLLGLGCQGTRPLAFLQSTVDVPQPQPCSLGLEPQVVVGQQSTVAMRLNSGSRWSGFESCLCHLLAKCSQVGFETFLGLSGKSFLPQAFFLWGLSSRTQ